MIRVFLTFSLASLFAAAQPVSFNLDAAHTAIHWTVDSTLHTVHGTFGLKSGVLRLDPSSGQASGAMVIDVSSGESGDGARDKRMHRVVLESQKFPEASFTAERIEGRFDPASAGQSFRLAGQLVLHGSPHALTLPIHATSAAGLITATTSFDIPYVEWGMKNPGNFLLKVSPIVHMEITATVHAQP